MHKAIIFIFIFTAALKTLSQKSEHSIDSLTQLISKESEDETSIRAKLEIAHYYNTSSPDSVTKYAKSALVDALEYGDYELIARSYWQLGNSKRMKNENDSAIFYFEKAADLAKGEELRANTQMGLGSVAFRLLRFEEALEYYLSAAESFEVIGNEKRQAAAYGNIGIVLNSTGSDEKAEGYFRKSINMSRRLNLTGALLPSLINLSTLFHKNEEYDSAILYATECLEICQTIKHTYGIGNSYMMLSLSHTGKNNSLLGLEYARKGKQIFKELGIQNSVNNMIVYEVMALKKLKRYNESLKLLGIIENDSSANSKFIIEHILLLKSQILEATGDLVGALTYHKMYFEQYEKFKTEETDEVIAEAEAKYENEKNRNEINSLKQEALIQAGEIRQKNLIIVSSTIGSILIVLLISIFNRQNRLAQVQKALSLEHKFLRTQLNPHFIFNSLTSVQNFLVKNDSQNAGIYLSKFARLMRQVLENSRREYVLLEEELSTLTNYLDIQKLRFKEKLTYIIKVDPCLNQKESMVPPMFAQPFIENSLEHGIAQKEGTGSILVEFKQHEKEVQMIIEDDGVGLIGRKKEGEVHRSLATTITQERIDLINSVGRKKMSFQLQDLAKLDPKRSGTRVVLIMPIMNA